MNGLHSLEDTGSNGFLTVVLETVRELFAFETSGRHTWQPEDIAVTTLFTCALNTSAETVQHVNGLPSADRVFDWLGEEQALVLGEKINQLLKKRLNRVNFPRTGKITVAADITEYPFYGNPDLPQAMGGKRKAGTNYFLKYLTFHLVVEGHRFPAGFYPLTKEQLQRVPEIVAEEVAWFKEREACDRILLDRGFNEFTVYNGINDQDSSFLMPLKRNEKLLQAFKDREPSIKKHERKNGFMLKGYRPPEWTGDYRVLAVRIKTRGKPTGDRWKWVFFITDMNISPRTALFLYKRRWGIETAYSQVHALEAITKSPKHGVRVFLTGLAFLLFSAWVYLNWQLARRSPARVTRGGTGKPVISRKRFKIAVTLPCFRLALLLSILCRIAGTNGKQALVPEMKKS
jgi:hypothetical protein